MNPPYKKVQVPFQLWQVPAFRSVNPRFPDIARFFSQFFSLLRGCVCVCVCAVLCSAGGERTVRHHALRDILATWVDRAGLQPEKKKGGLLLPLTIPAASGGGRQTCTSLHTLVHLLPLTWPSRPPRGRQPWEKLRAPVWRPLLPMRKPKQPIWKLLQHVGGKGLNFSPLVAEATGAWELKAAGFLRKISSAAAAREGADGEGLHAALLQELCVAARIVRAQAVLRRRAELAMATAPPAL